ncbi:MAG: class I SAM-dependent methyltransferase family protein [Methanothrix sp.]|jgi:tRNA (guanine37-N1)-methyltransferase|nr:class I SAM-dependent methyltransferase family protein [Methanothrix sp.]
MQDKSPGLKVSRKNGEKIRKALVEMGAFDRTRKICSDESHVYLPILDIDEIEAAKIRSIGQFELAAINFQLEEHVLCPEDFLGFRPSFEVVGDIAMVEDSDAERVAAALMSTSKSIKTVIAPISDVEGEFRTRRFRHVAGEARTVTLHKEHGLRYRVDLEGAYFTPRLGTERLRIAGLVSPDDVVLDMFAGVGPFALLLAKKGADVIAMDKNPVAVKYLRENALLNKVNNIMILEGDAADLALRYENLADHVIMNLPHSASAFLLPAIRAAKPDGIIHYYCIAPEDDLYGDEARIRRAAEEMNAGVEVLYKEIVRSYAPHRHNVVIDFRVKKHDLILY